MAIEWNSSFHNARYDARTSSVDAASGAVSFEVAEEGETIVTGTVDRDGCANADMPAPSVGVQLHWCDMKHYAAFSQALGWAIETAMTTAAKGPHLV